MALDAAIIIALIALVGSLFSTVATVFGPPVLQSRREARAVLHRHRDPLVAAAYELQARLHNILRTHFIETWLPKQGGARQQAAIDSTLYVFAQFLGWREIVYTKIQFLRLPRDEETRRVQGLLWEITETFLSDDYGEQFMIWRVEQRGLGERMIAASAEGPSCMGYAAFIEQRATMDQWLAPLEAHLKNLNEGGLRRLTKLQHVLLELVQTLDPDRIRYPVEYFALRKA